MRTTTVEVDVPVAVRCWGEGDRPLLFLHSMGPVSTGALVGVGVQPLIAAGYSVYAPDLPGYGETPPLPTEAYELSRLAQWMWSVADTLGLRTTTLVGHSWGGALACHLAASRPDQVDGLVLVDSGHIDFADVLEDEEVARSVDEWVERARSRRLHAVDAAAFAADFELDADDPLVGLLLCGAVAVSDGLVPRVRPEGQGAAEYYLARAQQSQTWPAISAAQIPT